MADEQEVTEKARLERGLRDRYRAAVARVDPDMPRSVITRALIRWYTGDTDELPARPPREGPSVGRASGEEG